MRHKLQVNVKDHLALDDEVEIKDQTVDRFVHRALNAVFNRDKAGINVTSSHSIEDLGYRRVCG
jgi:hypothetical protein